VWHIVLLQLHNYVDLSELHRVVLQYACVEVQVLAQEEGCRAFAQPAKLPRDSRFRWAEKRG
jgi:hypothetical protein